MIGLIEQYQTMMEKQLQEIEDMLHWKMEVEFSGNLTQKKVSLEHMLSSMNEAHKKLELSLLK